MQNLFAGHSIPLSPACHTGAASWLPRSETIRPARRPSAYNQCTAQSECRALVSAPGGGDADGSLGAVEWSEVGHVGDRGAELLADGLFLGGDLALDHLVRGAGVRGEAERGLVDHLG